MLYICVGCGHLSNFHEGNRCRWDAPRQCKCTRLVVRITPRETEVLRAIAGGFTSRQIADNFHVSIKTVEAHRHNLYTKLRVHGAADLVGYALKHKLLTVNDLGGNSDVDVAATPDQIEVLA